MKKELEWDGEVGNVPGRDGTRHPFPFRRHYLVTFQFHENPPPTFFKIISLFDMNFGVRLLDLVVNSMK